MKLPRTLPVKCQRFPQSISACPVAFVAWRPVLWSVLLAGSFVFSAPAERPQARQHSRSGSHAVQADLLPVTPEIQAPGSDLLLRKEGEQTAGALAAFSEGLAAEEDADTERALEAYRRSLALDPGNTELAVKVAFELARRDEVAQGIDLLKDAAKAAPKESLPPLCLSQLYGKFLKKPELAEKYALQALALDPENITAYLAVFELYTAAGQQKKADALLERAAKSTSSDPQFWLQLGTLHLRLAFKPDGTLSPEELRKINPMFEKALDLGKEDPDVLAKVADFDALTKQTKAAIPLYQKALDLGKEAAPDDLLAIRDKLASAFLADGQRDQAIAVLEQMIKDAPTRYETYELLGELYLSNSQPERALASYQQALLIDSTKPAKYLRIADLQLQLKKTADAVKTLTDARARFPGVAQLSYALGLALNQAKQFTPAISTFEEALHEAKNSGETLPEGPFYFAYGIAAEEAGDLDRAADLLRKSIQADPSNAAQAYNFLGYMWVEKGVHLEEAGELINRALALDPENGAYLDSIGWYDYQTGHYAEALTQLQKAVDRLQPVDPLVYEHLGDTHAALGDLPRALEVWRKALALAPENKELAGKIDHAQRKLTAAPAATPGKP